MTLLPFDHSRPAITVNDVRDIGRLAFGRRAADAARRQQHRERGGVLRAEWTK
jgi:hypothetical protein